MSMKIDGAVALVTGANRGIGRAIAEKLLERGAGKVYAAARNPEQLKELQSQHGDRLVPLKPDVTDAGQLREVAGKIGDVQIVINNAGVALGEDIGNDAIVDQARQEMEVNYFGPLSLVQHLAPALEKNGGGAVVNIASVAGLTNFPMFPTYSASKAAVHSLTQAQRIADKGAGYVRMGVEQKLQPFFLGLDGNQIAQVVEDFIQTEGDGLHLQLAGLDLGKIQDVVDDSQQ